LKLNINEIAFDLLLITFSLINFFFIENLFDSILGGSGFVIITHSLIFLLVPMLLGVYTARLESKYDGGFMRFIKVLIWLYYIIIAISLLVSSLGHLTQYATEEAAGSEVFGLIFIFVFMIIGPICGGLIKNREKALLSGEEPYGNNVAAMVIVIMATLAVMLFLMNIEFILSIVPFESMALNVTLGIILFIAIVTVSIILAFKWEPFFKTAKVKGLLHMGRSFIVPLIVATIFFFLFQMEMNILNTMERVDNECGFGCKMFIMVVTGMIPFRIIMLMAPPFRWLNLITGVTALIVTIWLQY
jgi:hypothetical protein